MAAAHGGTSDPIDQPYNDNAQLEQALAELELALAVLGPCIIARASQVSGSDGD